MEPVTALPTAVQSAPVAPLSSASICENVATRLATRVGETRYKRFFEPSAGLRLEGDALTVVVPSAFSADWLQRQFGADLSASAAEAGVTNANVLWKVAPEAFAPAESNAQATERAAAAQPALRLTGAGDFPAAKPAHQTRQPLPPRARLEDFVVGECNRLAYNAAVRLAESEDQRGPFGVLFIHGPSGVGKTHLLQGIAQRFSERRAGPRTAPRVRYVTGEQFANEYIASVHAGNIDAFRARYRGLDLLCLDDVHFLGGKTKTQDEFLHTFDTLELGGARVALVSDEHPSLLQRLTRQITSRFVSGMVVKLDPPDEPTRVSLARLIAARRRMNLTDDAARAVARCCRGSVRDLEGALLSVDAVARLAAGPDNTDAPGPISAALVTRALGEAAAPRPRRPIKVHTVLAAVCERLRVEQGDVLGPGRHKRVVLARSLAAFLARELTTQSYPEIARAFGRGNHSTVVTACQRIRAALDADKTCDCGPGFDAPLQQVADELRAEILGRSA